MKKNVLIASAAALALAAGGSRLLSRQDKPQESGRRLVEARESPIERTIEATGSIVPLNRVEIRPPIGGRVDELLAREGDKVAAGQTVAWMSSHDRAAILDSARAQGPEQLARWQEAYKPTPIVAPLSGTVILRNVVVGQTVEQGSVLYAMADTLIVLAQVDESDIGQVRPGMPARVLLDAYPDRSFSGKVFDILYEGKNVSNVITYGVKVRADRAPGFMRSQMTASVHFIAGRKEKALVLPIAALRQRADGSKQVMLPGPDGKPVSRDVVTGIETGDQVEIVAGLAAGEKVLLSRARYSPQQAPQSSPLAMGSRPAQQGQQQPGQGGGRSRRPR